MKKLFLVFTLTLVVIFSFYVASAGSQHGVNGLVNNAADGVDANGAIVTFVVTNATGYNYCNLTDVVGVNGLSKQSNWYAQDIGNCPVQWKENDTVYIYIVKDSEHNASTSVILSKIGNDQAPTVTLSSPPPLCGNGICSSNENCSSCPQDCGVCCGNNICEPQFNETCLTCPQDCATICNNNSVCEPCPNYCQPSLNDTFGCCENITNCQDCFCNPPNGICEPQYGENCSSCPFDCHCPDGLCQPEQGESNLSCQQDCRCGNAICEIIEGLCFTFIENSLNCLIDCPGCICGDGICQTECNENVESCCSDCCVECNNNGICDLSETFANCPNDCVIFCGNLICEPDKNETAESCPTDCEKSCGNNLCEPDKNENWNNCPQDCYTARCGDLKCELAENMNNCCKDCGCKKEGFVKGKFFIGRVAQCERNTCKTTCCMFNFCYGIYWNNFSKQLCWWQALIILIAIIIVLLIIVFTIRKIRKNRIKNKPTLQIKKIIK